MGYYIRSSTVLGKQILADKSDNHVLCCVTSQIWQPLQHGMGSWARPMGEQQLYSLSFPFKGGGKKLCVVLKRIFDCDFLCLHTTISKTIPGTVATVLRPLKSAV